LAARVERGVGDVVVIVVGVIETVGLDVPVGEGMLVGNTVRVVGVENGVSVVVRIDGIVMEDG